MTNASFVSNVESHPDLHFKTPPENGRYVVANSKGQAFEVFEKDITGEWPQWEMVLTGQRQAQIIEKFTRICGYYSDLNNWNASKISELKDRQKGNYKVH